MTSQALDQDTFHEKSLSIVLPVFNEELLLEPNVLKLLAFMESSFECKWEIVIADNASTDQTQSIGRKLSASYPMIKYLRIERKGVGIALKTAWKNSNADIQCHVDGDLPFELDDVKHVIQAAQQGYDICFGSRFAVGASNGSKPVRRFLSVAFHYWIKLLFSYDFSDICGIKAVRKDALTVLFPHLTNDGWFFNAELMLLADRAKMSIKEVPVYVKEPPGRKSKVKLLQTVTNLFIMTFKLKVKFWVDGPTSMSMVES